ncbi:MAG: Type II secretion system protein G precursor [Candidatus Omnitrophica bacterium ADurb.Bin277]|nr:MAG: Type II secretion system protein G precursor [Candidatus Omnitrophica bacterium ADurb.Bin277]
MCGIPGDEIVRRKTKNKKGFTLVELLVTIAVVTILAMIALPNLGPHREKTIVKEAIVNLQAIRQGEHSYRLDNNGYLRISAGASTSEWSKIGLEKPDTRNFQFSVAGNEAVATRQNSRNTEYNGRTIRINLENGRWNTAAGDYHPLGPQN